MNDRYNSDAKENFPFNRISLENCQKVFVDRDYSKGLEVKFQREMPDGIRGMIEPELWYSIVDGINSMFMEAERVGARSIGETLLAFFTCYFVRLCMNTRYEKQLYEIRRFIDEKNQTVLYNAGLYITDPSERGFRVLEISLIRTGLDHSGSGDRASSLNDQE